jgi:hypothetical protein
MSEEKPVEYYVEFSIYIKEKNGNSGSYSQEVYRQKVGLDYVHSNPSMIAKVIAIINKLEVPNV